MLGSYKASYKVDFYVLKCRLNERLIFYALYGKD